MSNINKNKKSSNFKAGGECTPNVRTFLLELRTNVLNISIQKFIECLNWNDEKYYQQVINGYMDKKTNTRKYKNPTVNYLFTGLNYAFKNCDIFKENKKAIIELIFKYIIIIN